MTLPIYMGSELVGTIEKLGGGVNDFERRYSAKAPVRAIPKTPSTTFVQAAALPLADSTAWQAIFDEAGPDSRDHRR